MMSENLKEAEAGVFRAPEFVLTMTRCGGSSFESGTGEIWINISAEEINIYRGQLWLIYITPWHIDFNTET